MTSDDLQNMQNAYFWKKILQQRCRTFLFSFKLSIHKEVK